MSGLIPLRMADFLASKSQRNPRWPQHRTLGTCHRPSPRPYLSGQTVLSVGRGGAPPWARRLTGLYPNLL
jgi:hypothetical protein